MGFDDIVTSVLLLIATYMFLWPRTQRPATPRRQARPAQRMVRGRIRTRSLTNYGALAYVVMMYCAVAVMIVRDVVRACTNAWRDVFRPKQVQKTVAQKFVSVDDDFAESRAKVAAWNYVTPKAEQQEKQRVMQVVQPIVMPSVPVVSAKRTLTDQQQKVIAKLLAKGASANELATLLGGGRGETLALIAKIKADMSEQHTAAQLLIESGGGQLDSSSAAKVLHKLA